MHLFRNAFLHLCNHVAWIFAFSFWVIARQFAANCKIASDDGDFLANKVRVNKWYEIETQFRALQELSCLINKIIGSNMTLLTVDNTMLHGSTFDKIFSTGGSVDWIEVVTSTNYILYAVGLMLISPDVCNQVNFDVFRNFQVTS